MKKIIFCAFATALMFGCNPENTNPTKEYVTIDFEEVILSAQSGDYQNILWGKELAIYDDALEYSIYDDILYTEDIASFGSYFSNQWGDFWSGFAFSNAALLPNGGEVDYSKQFNVAATSTTKFAVGYCSPSGGWRNGGEYEDPTIVLSEPKTFTSAEFANTTVEYLYADDNAQLWYYVTATGYLNGNETGKVEIKLIENGVAKSGWKTISLTALGSVDKIIFTADSNDRNSSGLLCPAYFCIDNLKYEITE